MLGAYSLETTLYLRFPMPPFSFRTNLPPENSMSKNILSKLTRQAIWITQTKAAALRGVTTAAIACLLRDNRLRCKLVAGRRLVHREDVINFKPLVAGVGRPSRSMKQAAMALVDHDKWITQKEAADLRQLTISGIKTIIARGCVRTLKKEGVLFLMKKDVLDYQPRIDFHPESGPQSALPPGTNPENWITVAEAARIRDVNQGTITTYATSKRIRSIKTGDTRLIYREDIVNFKRKPRTSRQKKSKRFLRFLAGTTISK